MEKIQIIIINQLATTNGYISQIVQLLSLLQNQLKQGKGETTSDEVTSTGMCENQRSVLGAKEISCYIKSVAMTDQVMKQIHEIAEREGGDWSMMYFSDRGLPYINQNSPGAHLMHGDKTHKNYEVPFLFLRKIK